MHPPPSDGTLTAFDWFLVLVLATSTIAAFARGLIRVLLSLAGLVAGILVASWYYAEVAQRLSRWIISYVVCECIAFLFLLVLVVAAFTLTATILRKTVSAVGLGFIDRLLGAVFGVVRGALLGVAAMMVLTAFFPESPWLENSLLAPYFLSGVHALSFVVPDHFEDRIAVGTRHLMHTTPGLFRPER
jgi:membrane protein required for colicin V production